VTGTPDKSKAKGPADGPSATWEKLGDFGPGAADLRSCFGDRGTRCLLGIGAAAFDRIVHQSILLRAMEHGSGFTRPESPGNRQRSRARRRRADHRGSGAIWIEAHSRVRHTGSDRGDTRQRKPC
jgi:hypothetical protein